MSTTFENLPPEARHDETLLQTYRWYRREGEPGRIIIAINGDTVTYSQEDDEVLTPREISAHDFSAWLDGGDADASVNA